MRLTLLEVVLPDIDSSKIVQGLGDLLLLTKIPVKRQSLAQVLLSLGDLV
ncbi:hypothetical protein ES703_92547 [subsurface metagenome]